MYFAIKNNIVIAAAFSYTGAVLQALAQDIIDFKISQNWPPVLSM